MTTDYSITMKTTSAEHGQNMFCACSFHGNSRNNFLSYCRLVDARISASEKYLPVPRKKSGKAETGICDMDSP